MVASYTKKRLFSSSFGLYITFYITHGGDHGSDKKVSKPSGVTRSKGTKNRVVPISDRLAAAIEAWSRLVVGDGPILRALARNGEAGDSLSGVGLFYIVRNYGRQLARVEKQDGRRQQLRQLARHDLRRTYAQIGYESGIAITQISKLLGHSSVTTTQRYLNLELDLETTISDFVPFE
jgi:integrase